MRRRLTTLTVFGLAAAATVLVVVVAGGFTLVALSGDAAPLQALGVAAGRPGAGYPHGLRGEQIPVEGRIVAIADVFDALTTERRYKAAFSFDRAAATMRAEAGHFDPGLLERFLGARDEVEQIRDAHPDRLVVRSVTHP